MITVEENQVLQTVAENVDKFTGPELKVLLVALTGRKAFSRKELQARTGLAYDTIKRASEKLVDVGICSEDKSLDCRLLKISVTILGINNININTSTYCLTKFWQALKTWFYSLNKTGWNWAKETGALKRLARLMSEDLQFSGPEDQRVWDFLEVYKSLLYSNKSFWKSQPALPSRLASSGIWPMVVREWENRQVKIDTTKCPSCGADMVGVGCMACGYVKEDS